jgi:spore maturation protein SpmA/spore maturation protein SpmB
MNAAFAIMVLAAVAVAGWADGTGGNAMAAVSTAAITAAEAAVSLALRLAGTMALVLGLVKLAEAGGLVASLSRCLAGFLGRLFPRLSAEDPALGAMAMALSANLLGLGNAATPLGLKAMAELDRLNPHKGVATDSMVRFLALNTAGLTLVPTSVIALRASLGAANPAAVILPTLLASLVAATVGVAVSGPLARLFPVPVAGTMPDQPAPRPAMAPRARVGARRWRRRATAAVLGLALVAGALAAGPRLGPWLIPTLMAGVVGWGLWRRVAIYEVFVAGARDGIETTVRILPNLVAILVAIAMLKASGAFDLLLSGPAHWLAPWGVPPEVLTLALIRTLSGSGAYGLLASLLGMAATGPDTPTGLLLGTVYGSTETTFYVLSVYFGAQGIRRMRHALAVGLIVDGAALAAAVIACRILG